MFENTRLTSATHFQDTRKISLGFESNVTYEPGDVLMLLPKNDEQMVTEFIKLVGLEPNTLLKITADRSQLG